MGRSIAFDPDHKNRGKGRRKGKVSVDLDSANLTGSLTFYNAPVVNENQVLIASDSNTIKGIAAASAKPVFWVVDKADILDTVNRLPGNTSQFTNEAEAYSYLASSNKYFLIKNESLTSTTTDGLVVDLDSTQKISYPTSGNTWYDLSGNSNNATLSNGPTFKSSVLNFDGTNDYATISSNSTFNVDKRTVEITFRMNGSYSNFAPLAIYANGSSTSHRIWLGLQNSKFRMHGWGTSDPEATTTIEANKWYTCVWSYDGAAEQMKMYTNGVLETTHTQTEGGITGVTGNNWYLATVPGGWQSQTYSNVSIKSFKVYDRVLSADEVAKNYYHTSVSPSNITFAIDSNNFMSNPLKGQKSQFNYDYTTWNLGSTSATGFSRNGGSDENIIESNTDPFGNTGVIWAGRNNTVSSDSDGGWNGSSFLIRNTEYYRFLVWISRPTVGNGYSYLGLNGFDINGNNVGVKWRSNGTNTTNPYFTVPNYTFFTAGDWYLLVGHVHPAGSGTGANLSDTGIYNTSGTKVSTPSDFVWRDDNTSSRHRTYLYYSTDPSTVQLWAYPRVDLCDGTEPTIAELLANAPNKIYDLVGRDALMLKNNCILNQNWVEFGGQNNAEISLNSTITPGNGAWTINMWVNGDSLGGYNILSNNSGGPVTSAFGFDSNKMMYYHYNGSWHADYGNTTLSTGKWYMLTYVNYSNSTMKMFLNGNPDSGVFTSTTSNGGPVNAIGRNWTSTNFDGKLSSMYMWNTSLTDAQVLTYYNETKGYFGY